MQVSNPNDVKIYNLSAGKSLPEWLSDRRKRSLAKQDVELQRRIELLQDFEMPTVSTCVQMTPDQQYIYTAGTYKPRIRCHDVSQMSMKFERCVDADIVKFIILSDDYCKLCLLQADRYIEFHSQYGRYYRLRIPKYGRDLSYHKASCDMYFVGVSSQIYRLNLEQGRFLNSLQTDASEINCCEFNPAHQLFACGTVEGHIECWDPRVRQRVGKLDCALHTHVADLELGTIPAVTSMKFRDALTLGVGTSTGHILLYDIRSNKPVLIKDHQYGLPIKNIAFQESLDLVLSMDIHILKLWNRNTGKPFTAVEPGTALNDLYTVPDSGLFFMANESPKLLTYYIPTLGPAPKWCSFLDNLTEELEENSDPTVYDDYKFVARRELEDLGLAHLIGSGMLRAYMHGFFIDVRLYQKAKALVDPFAYERYRKEKVREKIEQTRTNRVKVMKLPKVNRNLAEKLLEAKAGAPTGKKKKKSVGNLLEDDRFSAMFSNPDFEIDPETDEYKLLNPLVGRLDNSKRKKAISMQVEPEHVQEEEREGRGSDDDSSSSDDDEDTRAVTEELKRQHRRIRQEREAKRWQEREEQKEAQLKPKFFELKEDYDFNTRKGHSDRRKELKQSLADRLAGEDDVHIKRSGASIGNKEMTYTLRKGQRDTRREDANRAHHAERKKIRRSAAEISKQIKSNPKYWMGKRVQ